MCGVISSPVQGGPTIWCELFIPCSMCGVQHLQRGGNRQFDLFESLWFSMVTFSTVGYGDIYPDIWISQLYMLTMIFAALIVFPRQVRSDIETYIWCAIMDLSVIEYIDHSPVLCSVLGYKTFCLMEKICFKILQPK
jgi:hypothetical protein